jgi:MFS family permease
MIDKIGRRKSLTSSLLVCGITCIISAFIPENIFWLQILLCLTGKMAITSSFAIIFIYSGTCTNICYCVCYFSNFQCANSRNDAYDHQKWQCGSFYNVFEICRLSGALCATPINIFTDFTSFGVWCVCIHGRYACNFSPRDFGPEASRHNTGC